MTTPSLVGVLVAAGLGRRFGGRKQLHPWPTPGGPTPLVAVAFDAIAGVCDAMVVVTGAEADAVMAALQPRAFEAVPGDPHGEMLDSIRAGLTATRRLAPRSAALLQPGDHPAVAPRTLTQLIETHRANPALAIMPEYAGKGGHPVLMPPCIIDAVLAAGVIEGGLRCFWEREPTRCRRVVVDDASIVRDVDRREDAE
ncbi:MAG: NTP transferase domain-containing protein [Phycisphaerales bacterium]|nr:NTP transferase domain-containing protein [Phycisphaerales bacterium]NNM24690.1 NTP transferase domain-containing protein [Phycisphaerales bacterium]